MQNGVQVSLDYYAMRGWIAPRQFDAGAEFHRLWYLGAVTSRFVQMRLDAAGGGELAMELDEARQRFEATKKGFRSLAQALLCYNVCRLGEWATYVMPIRAVLDGYGSEADRGILRAA